MSNSYNDDLNSQSSRDRSTYVDYEKLALTGNGGDDDDLKIIAVQKEISGEVRAYKLSDGRIVSVQKAVDLCNRGILGGYITATRWDGDAYIRTRPDGTRGNNLSNVPEF